MIICFIIVDHNYIILCHDLTTCSFFLNVWLVYLRFAASSPCTRLEEPLCRAWAQDLCCSPAELSATKSVDFVLVRQAMTLFFSQDPNTAIFNSAYFSTDSYWLGLTSLFKRTYSYSNRSTNLWPPMHIGMQSPHPKLHEACSLGLLHGRLPNASLRTAPCLVLLQQRECATSSGRLGCRVCCWDPALVLENCGKTCTYWWWVTIFLIKKAVLKYPRLGVDAPDACNCTQVSASVGLVPSNFHHAYFSSSVCSEGIPVVVRLHAMGIFAPQIGSDILKLPKTLRTWELWKKVKHNIAITWIDLDPPMFGLHLSTIDEDHLPRGTPAYCRH